MEQDSQRQLGGRGDVESCEEDYMVFKSFTSELTILRTVEVEKEENALWDNIWEDIESVVLLEGVISMYKVAFSWS